MVILILLLYDVSMGVICYGCYGHSLYVAWERVSEGEEKKKKMKEKRKSRCS